MLKGQKINLVPISFDDTDLILKWRNNNSVKSNFIFRKILTKSMHEAWLNEKIATGKAVQFIIIENKTGRKIGSAYLRDINKEHNNAEFGIFIGEDDARGIGYGSEAAKIVTEYGFHELGLHRIFLRVFESNKQAIKSYLNAGYEIEGTAREMILLKGGGVSKYRFYGPNFLKNVQELQQSSCVF